MNKVAEMPCDKFDHVDEIDVDELIGNMRCYVQHCEGGVTKEPVC